MLFRKVWKRRRAAWNRRLWISGGTPLPPFLDDFVECYSGKCGSGGAPLGTGAVDKRRDAASTLNGHDRTETDRFKAFAYKNMIKRDQINPDIF